MQIRFWPVGILGIVLSGCAVTPQPQPVAVGGAAPATAAHQPDVAYDPRVEETARRSREMGYHVETRHGEQFYCRTTAPLGSRLTQKECLTTDGMAQAIQMAEENQAAQRQGQLCQGGGCAVR
jgi:hypothetical protein